MIVNQDQLELSTCDMSVRNSLISQLCFAKENDEFYIPKLILAFWLGSNLTVDVIENYNDKDYSRKEKFNDLRPYIYIAYYCCLILDKQSSLLPISSKAQKILAEVQFKIFNFINTNPENFLEGPDEAFKLFKIYFEAIKNDDCEDSAQRATVDEAKKACLEELGRSISVLKTLGPRFSENASHVQNRGLNIFDLRNCFNVAITRLIAGSCKPKAPHLFFSSPLEDPLSYRKMLVRAHDGILLDGLSFSFSEEESRPVVLALFGHFQVESQFFLNYMRSTSAVFGVNTVFINHRNYSSRSAKFADHMLDFSLDVCSFAQYFHEREKRIVLYGMCGGAPIMILAANILMRMNIKFKLILDRSFQKYSDCHSLKDFIYILQNDPLFINYQLPLAIPLFFGLVGWQWLKNKALYYSANDIDFADLVRAIPENDLLILQIKTKKQTSISPKVIDVFVPPKNNIREAVASRRHHNKEIFKSLSQCCLEIARTMMLSKEMQCIFLKFTYAFDRSLELIDNEKLTRKLFCPSKFDAHADRLFDLRTRNDLPIAQFIGGFFAKPSKNSIVNLRKLVPYKEEEISLCLQKHHFNYWYDPRLPKCSRLLAFFLKTVNEHQDLIANFFDRSLMTKFGNFNVPILNLHESDLFKDLRKLRTPGMR